jgi:hypothetical protein
VSAAAGSGLVAQPDSLLIRGPDRASWLPLRDSADGRYQSAQGAPFVYPDDGRATACASARAFRACVYPVYGSGLARRLVSLLEPEAELLRGFPAVAATLRMVLVTGTDCLGAKGELLFRESSFRDDLAESAIRGTLGQCVLPLPEALRGLRSVWDRLRTGALSLTELPGS